MAKSVLITGSTGFIGKHLSRYLLDKSYKVFEVARPAVDLAVFETFKNIEKNNYDYIIHLAVVTQPGTFCKRFPADQFIINDRINTNMIEWWRDNASGAKFLGFGTSASYSPDERDLSEDNYLSQSNDQNYLGYWASKRNLYYGLKAMDIQYGSKYLYIVPSMVYGSGYDLSKDHWHFIYDIIAKILHAKKTGGKPILWGDGLQRRELIHISDFCECVEAAMLGLDNQILNVGSGVSYSIREIVSEICSIIHYDEVEVQYDTNAFVGSRDKVLNVKKLNKFLKQGNNPDLGRSLRETVQWVENYINETDKL